MHVDLAAGYFWTLGVLVNTLSTQLSDPLLIDHISLTLQKISYDIDWLFYVELNSLTGCEGHFSRNLNEDENYLGVVKALQTFNLLTLGIKWKKLLLD